MPENPISGQSPPMNTPATTAPAQVYASPPFSLILTIILIVFFFISFFSIYFCKCFLETVIQAWHLQRTTSGNRLVRSSSSQPANPPGLDPKIIKSFPAFPYSSVKNLRTEKNSGLECAICLSEFADDDVLRLFTTCYHVFHRDCVDLWLESHKTCPVCRHDLESYQIGIPNENEDVPLRDEMIINIIRENHDGGDDDQSRPEVVVRSDRGDSDVLPEKFGRSHSTGHSIVRTKPEGNRDRYTLRLPENVEIKVVGKGHNQTESCVTFGELTRSRHRNNGGFGEVSGHNH